VAALTSASLSLAGTLASPVAVSSSDTIAESQFGTFGVILRVINGGGSPDNVTISDPNLTLVGNPGTVTAVAVANATTKSFFIPRSAINASSNQATVAHSFTTSVTCELYRI